MKAHPSGVAGNRKDENDADRETPQLKIKKLKKKLNKILAVQKFVVTLHSFSALPKRSNPNEHIERFTIDIKSSTRAKKKDRGRSDAPEDIRKVP